MTVPETLETEYGRLLRKAGLSRDELSDLSSTLDIGDRLEDFISAHGSQGLDLSGLADPVRQMRDHPFLAGASQGVLRCVLTNIEASATVCNLRIPYPLYAGEFPTYEINGCIVPARNGALILINSGLIFLLHHISDILASFAISNVPRSGNAWPNVGVDRNSQELTTLCLGNALLAYLSFDLKERPARPRVPGFFQWVVSRLVWQETVHFVLAHEVAHAIRGHLEVPQASPQQEFEADETGLFLVRRQPIRPEGLDSELVKLIEHARFAAPFFFFSFCTLVDHVLAVPVVRCVYEMQSRQEYLPVSYRYARAEKAGATHPPASGRLEAIQRLIGDCGTKLPLALAYFSAMSKLEADTVKLVQTWCERVLNEARTSQD